MSRTAALLRRLQSAVTVPLRRFAVDQAAVSAVEFAFLLPIILPLYLAGVEVSRLVSADRKTSQVAHTVADLIAQQSCFSTDLHQVMTYLGAAAVIIAPYNPSALQVTVSSVLIDATNKKATVQWSKTYGTGAQAESGDVTTKISAISPNLLTVGNSLIWAEATYNYSPIVPATFTFPLGMGKVTLFGPLSLKEQMFLHPRQADPIPLQASCSG
jgi:Flp pilus assembly protein TadG